MAALDPIEDLRQKLESAPAVQPPPLEPAQGATIQPPARVLPDIQPAISIADLSSKLEPAASLPVDSIRRGTLQMGENLAGALETLSSLGSRSEPYAGEAKQLGDVFAAEAAKIDIPVSSIRDIDFSRWDTAARDTFKLGVNAAFEMVPQIVPAMLAGAVIPGGALARQLATFLPSAAQEIGGIFRGTREETGKEGAGTAIILGSMSGALESIVPANLLRRLFDSAPDGVKRATWRTLLGESVKAIGKTAGEEFATEGAQEALALAANKVADNQYDLVNSENFIRLLDAGIKGALGGGAAGGVTEVAAQAPRLLRRQVPEISVPTQDVATLGQAQPVSDTQTTTVSETPALPAAPATFLGYQFSVPGTPPIPLFNLTEDAAGKLKGSTVAGPTLEQAGFSLPEIPPPPAQQLTTPGQMQAQWPPTVPTIPAAPAMGKTGILELIRSSPLTEKPKAVLTHLVNRLAPGYLDNLQFQVVPGEIQGAPAGTPARYQPIENLIQIVQQSTDEAIGPHEVAHHLEQFLPESERRTLAQVQLAMIDRALQNPRLPAAAREYLENLRAKPVSSEEFVRLNAASPVDLRPWYRLSNPSEFFADALARRSLKDYARQGELKSLLGRAKTFLRELWTGIKAAFGNDDSRTERIINKLLNGQFPVTPQSGVSAEQKFALPKAVTRAEATALQETAELRPEELAAVKQLIGVQNAAIVSPPAAEAFAALPQPVKDVLKFVQNRIDRIREAGVSADYRDAMADPSINADAKSILTLGSLYNYLDFERSIKGLTRAKERAVERLEKLHSPEVQEQMSEATLQEDYLKQVIELLVTRYRDELIAQRNAAATAQRLELVDAYTQELKDLELLRRNNVALKRVLQDIAANTSIEELNTLSPQQLTEAWWTRNSVNPSVGQDVALQAFRLLKVEGRLNQQILDLKLLADPKFRQTVTQLDEMVNREVTARKLSLPEFLGKYYAARSDLDAARKILNIVRSRRSATLRRLTALLHAEAFVNRMQQSPYYQQNREAVLENSGAQSAEVTQVGDTSMTMEDPYDPQTKYQFFTRFDRPFAEDELATFQKAREVGQRYVEDPNADPLKRRAWEQKIYEIDNFYLNPAFNPTSGKLIPLRFDPFRAATLGGFASVPDYELSLIGGRSAAEALTAYSAYSTAKQQTGSLFTRYQSRINLAAQKAAKSHGLTPTEWNEKVLEPLIASRQTAGSSALQLGDSTIYGETINASDLAAFDIQKEYYEKLREIILNKKEIASIALNPAKVLEKVSGRMIRRDPLARGSDTMSRRLSQEARDFSNAWRGATNLEQFLRDTLQGDQLIRIVGSHAESLQDPSYTVKSNLKEDFKPALQQWRDGHGPATFDELLDSLVAAQATKPAGTQFTRAQLIGELSNDLGRIADNIARTEQPRPEGAAKPLLEIIDTNNSFTQARGQMIVPRSFYDHSVTDDRRKIYALHDGLEFFAGNAVAKLESLATAVGQQVRQYEQEIHRGKPVKQVEKESKAAQQRGDTFLNYQEAKTTEKRLRILLQQVKDAIARSKGVEFEMVNASSSVQNLVVGSLLQSVGTMLRNTFGGITRFVQIDQALGRGINLFNRQILPGWLPGVSTAGGVLRGAAAIGKEYVKLLEIGLGSRALKSKTAQRLLTDIKKNPDFFNSFGGRMLSHLSESFERHQRMLELGIGQPSAAMDNLKAAWYLRKYGGKIIEDNPTATRTVARHIEAALSAMSEIGVGVPRALFPRVLDLGINAAALDYAEKQVERLKINALQYLGNRAQLGLDTRLTPEELLGSRFATEKQAATLRQFFLKQGMNLDKLMVDYYEAVQKAKAEGRDPASVPFLTEGQQSSLSTSIAEEVNLGTSVNRPPLLKARQLNRVMGLLMGYPMWLNTRFSQALAKSSKTKIPAESLWLFSAWMMAMGLAALGSHELLRILLPLLYNEERPIPSVFTSDNATEALETIATNMAAFVPVFGGLYNYLQSSPNRTGFGIQFLPVTFAMDALNTAKSMWQTGEALNPAINFTRRWVPNSRIVLNRLDIRDGLTEYYNVNRVLRAEAPEGVELRKPSGGDFQQTPTTFLVQGMVNSAMRDDVSEFMRLYQEAVSIRRTAGVANPEESVQKSFAAKNFYTTVYGRELSDGERTQLFNKLTPEQATRIREAENKFARFSELIGGQTPDFVRSEGGAGGSIVSAPREASAAPFSAFAGAAAPLAGGNGTATSQGPRRLPLLRRGASRARIRVPKARRPRTRIGRRRLLPRLRFR